MEKDIEGMTVAYRICHQRSSLGLTNTVAKILASNGARHGSTTPLPCELIDEEEIHPLLASSCL
jgi:hypothetical protein